MDDFENENEYIDEPEDDFDTHEDNSSSLSDRYNDAKDKYEKLNDFRKKLDNKGKEAGKNAGQNATKQGGKEAGKKLSKKGGQELGKGAAKKGAQEVGKEAGKQVAKGAAKEGAKVGAKAGAKAAVAASGAATAGVGTAVAVAMEVADRLNKVKKNVEAKVNAKIKENTGVDMKAAKKMFLVAVIFLPFFFFFFVLTSSTLFLASEETHDDLQTLINKKQVELAGDSDIMELITIDGKTELKKVKPLLFMSESDLNDIVKDYKKWLKDEKKGDYDQFMPDPKEDDVDEQGNVVPKEEVTAKLVKKYLNASAVNFSKITWKEKSLGKDYGKGTYKGGYSVGDVNDFAEVGDTWLSNLFGKFIKIPDPDVYTVSPSLKSSDKDKNFEEMKTVYYNMTKPYLQNWVVPYSLNIATQDNRFGEDVLNNMSNPLSIQLLKLDRLKNTVRTWYSLMVDVQEKWYEYKDYTVEYTISYSTYNPYTYVTTSSTTGVMSRNFEIKQRYNNVSDDTIDKVYADNDYGVGGCNTNKFDVNDKFEVIQQATNIGPSISDSNTQLARSKIGYSVGSSYGLYSVVTDVNIVSLTYKKRDKEITRKVSLRKNASGEYIKSSDGAGEPILLTASKLPGEAGGTNPKIDKEFIKYKTTPVVVNSQGFYQVSPSDANYEINKADDTKSPDEIEYPSDGVLDKNGREKIINYYDETVGTSTVEAYKDYKLSYIADDEYKDLGRKISRIEWLLDFGNAGDPNITEYEMYPTKTEDEKKAIKLKYYTLPNLTIKEKIALDIANGIHPPVWVQGYSYEDMYFGFLQIDKFYNSDTYTGLQTDFVDIGSIPPDGFAWPVDLMQSPGSNVINYLYGVTEAYGSKSHGGIDVSHGNTLNKQGNLTIGPNIIATHDGEVVDAQMIYFSDNTSKNQTSYGNFVRIKTFDGKFTTTYGHLSSIAVRVGQKVMRGQIIATMGDTGNSFGTHLHYEVKEDGNARDPLLYYETDPAYGSYVPRAQTPAYYYKYKSSKSSGVSNSVLSGGFMGFLASAEGAGPSVGDKYEAYDDGAGYITIGMGITWKDHISQFGQYGITSMQVGDLVDKTIVDAIKAQDINKRIANIKTLLAKNNITDLKQNQIDALISYHYNVGNINNFPAAYLQYGNTEALYTAFFSKPITAKGVVMTGLKKRRKAEWNLFHLGVYTTDVYSTPIP